MKETKETQGCGAEFPAEFPADIQLVDSRTAAKLLGVSMRTVERWREKMPAVGPKPLRLPLSRRIRYRVSDIREFVEAMNARADGGDQ